VGGNTLLVWVHRDKVGPFMNGLHFFYGIGAFLAPIVVAWAVLLSGDITWAYWALALLILPSAIWLLRLPSPPMLKTGDDGKPGRTNRLLVALIALFYLLYVGAEISFGGWIFTYAVRLNLADETVAAYLTSTFWGAFTAGRLLAIPVAARFRPRTILLVDIVGSIVSLIIILLWTNSLVMAWLGTFTIGLSMASIFPTMISFAERRMTLTGQITAWFFVGGSIGAMLVPWLIGQLFESVGPWVTMLILLVDLLLAVLIFAVVMSYSTRLSRLDEAVASAKQL